MKRPAMTYDEFLAEWRSPAPFCVVHTSGSTGAPKEIRLPKELMARSAERTNAFFGLRPGEHIHSCIAADFIGGKMMAVRAERGDLRLTWEEPSSRPDVLRRFAGHLPRLVALVPAQMLHILDSLTSEEPGTSWPMEDIADTVWLLGGSAIDSILRKRIAASRLNAWETYGMTETASHVALRRVEAAETPFRPLPDVELSLNGEGCLVIRQYGQTIVTNDLAELTADGGFRILGRSDNVIITGGRKVRPEHVETTLGEALRPLGIEGVMLTGEPDEKWGQRLVLLMETGVHAVDAEAVAEAAANAARSLLERHEVPKEFRLVDALPRTANGKLLRVRQPLKESVPSGHGAKDNKTRH